ncbi:MAG TPA: NUDIX hydrolase [Thermobifida alba]|nr:NUDIX hydrolase [Thermobifida alba]
MSEIRLTADVVALAPDDDGLEHVLLIRRRWAPYEGHWALPGGHVDQGEEAVDAAARELREETGLDITPDALTELGAWHAPGRDPRGRYVTVAYRADLPHRATTHAADDAADARWWPVDALADLAVAFDHRKIIARALASRYPARSTARGPVGVQAAVVADTTVVQTWTR